MTERFPSTVTLQGVSRAFGRTFALHRADLELRSRSITALIGDNGAGKSTLLNILATIDEPTSGTITYGEISRRNFARRARHRIGWVSHQALLYDELTARENLRFYAGMYGLKDIDHRAASWLDRVGLNDAADRMVRNFSRGMKQRLTIARALIHNPQLLLFDEPATGLDQQGNRFLIDLLNELRDRGRIVVLVSHDFELISSLADRVVVLRRGQIALEAATDGDFNLLEAYGEYA